jgi:glycerol-3-phosphate dehydrogenase (NAD(P)+)
MVAQNGSNNNSLTHERTKITVIGGGAWGTALAIHAARMGHDTLLWARETEVVEGINGPDKENKLFLKGFKVPENLKATGDAAAAVEHGELLLTVIPTPFLAVTLKPLKDKFRPDQIIISCTKGIQNETLETPDQILQRVLPEALHSRLAFLSGPSFAAEVAAEQPTCVTIASTDQAVAARAQTMLSTPRFRCYRTSDVRGVELGGALKNVLAIACGIADGLQFGNNARAALITRGLAEITKLAIASGAHPLTMGGLAGMGDLVLTCTGDLSRNRTVGLRIGKGEKLEDIIKSMNAVAEGVLTSKSAYNLAHKLNVDTPIVEGIYRVIHGGADPAGCNRGDEQRPAGRGGSRGDAGCR